mgnify:CR=1 FL=1
MPYVGNSPASNFASVTKDTFSGDGSTTAFTLSKAATTNGVAVYVENVRQIPTTAYTVSGTTLDFGSGNAPVSGTNNIYVLHHNSPASTATHPAAQALTATSGTFTGTVTAGSTLDMNGTELILDADADTSITADTDDVIDFKFGGTDRIQFTSAGAIITTPSSGGNTIINEAGVDADFRIEGVTSTHAFFVKGDDSNIGIGTSTPDRMGSANQRGIVTIASNSYAVFELVNGDADGAGNVSTINFVFDNNGTNNNGQTALIRGFTEGSTANNRGGRLSFFTKNDNASGLNEHLRISNSGTLTGTDTDGIGSISDERLKTNIQDFTYSIEDFKKYKPKKFDWKHPDMHGGRSGQWGFSAQDVEKIDERFVDEYKVEDTTGIKDENGNQIVHPDKQYLDADDIAKSSRLQQRDAMYISVIQQLIARIEALESK